MNIIWWYFWCLVKIDVFQLYGAIIYNKLYIAVFKEEIMMNWDHSLPESQISPFYTFPHLAQRGSCIYHLGLSHLIILSSRSFSSAAWWKVFSKHLFFFLILLCMSESASNLWIINEYWQGKSRWIGAIQSPFQVHPKYLTKIWPDSAQLVIFFFRIQKIWSINILYIYVK